MKAVAAGLAWASGLVIPAYLILTTIWPSSVAWEDVVFVGAPLLLIPLLLRSTHRYQDTHPQSVRMVCICAVLALTAFVVIIALSLVLGNISGTWFMWLVWLTLLIGPAITIHATFGFA